MSTRRRRARPFDLVRPPVSMRAMRAPCTDCSVLYRTSPLAGTFYAPNFHRALHRCPCQRARTAGCRVFLAVSTWHAMHVEGRFLGIKYSYQRLIGFVIFFHCTPTVFAPVKYRTNTTLRLRPGPRRYGVLYGVPVCCVLSTRTCDTGTRAVADTACFTTASKQCKVLLPVSAYFTVIFMHEYTQAEL